MTRIDFKIINKKDIFSFHLIVINSISHTSSLLFAVNGIIPKTVIIEIDFKMNTSLASFPYNFP